MINLLDLMSLLRLVLLLVNAMAIINEERVLKKCIILF